MATPITLKQRVYLSADRKSLVVRQQQGNQVRTQEIALPEEVKRTKDIHNITELVKDWPKTELKIDAEFRAGLEDSE